MDKINYKEGDYLVPFKRAIYPLKKEDFPFWRVTKKTFGTWGDTFKLEAYWKSQDKWVQQDDNFSFFDLQKKFRLASSAEVLLYVQE